MDSTRNTIESILSERIEDCHIREATAFDRAIEGKRQIILFGAGGLGRKVLNALRREKIEPLAFIDNKLAGTQVDGLQVMLPAEAAEKWRTAAAFVITIWASWADTMQEQMKSLRQLGCETTASFIPLLWKFPYLLPHVQIDLPSRVLEQSDRVLEAFDSLSDAPSQNEFLGQVRWRLFADFDALKTPVPNPYWQPDLIRLSENACFVDAGAFDGDTFTQFADFTHGKFRSAYLFEPDRPNLAAIHKRLRRFPADVRDRVRVFPFALSDSNGELPFSGGLGAGSAVGAGEETVQCVALDDVISEEPDYIKYDIEGFEVRALTGTRRIIEEHRPTIAACSYHIQNHLWEVPLLIRSLNPKYRLYLRPHGQVWETVCYAVPK